MAEPTPRRVDGRLYVALAALAGLAAVAIAMASDVAPGLLGAISRPPTLVAAALAGGSILLGLWLLASAVERIGRSMQRDSAPDGRISDVELGTLVRGVRLVFLAAAAFTAAAGWILAEPLPLVIALVIAGVDVVETSFLLLVAGQRRDRD